MEWGCKEMVLGQSLTLLCSEFVPLYPERVCGLCRSEVVRYARHLISAGTYESAEEKSNSVGPADARLKSAVTSPAQSTESQGKEGDGQNKLPEKRVSNVSLKRDLGVHLRFPTYREGLAGIHAGNHTPFD